MTTDRSEGRAELMGGHAIRRFRPGDREEFCSLYELVLDGPASIEWFDWKYTNNPYFDPVPAFVAEAGGRLVGARPFFALPVRAGERTYTAFQPADAMVRSAHRRRGLFSRMTERALDWLAETSPPGAFCFNFPNERSLPGDLKLGWRTVGTVPTYYRIERPDRLLEADGVVGRLAEAVGRGFLQGVSTLRRSPSDVSVVRREGVAASTLAALYEHRVPQALHVHRTETFYRWRFSNPNWEYATYVAGPPDAPIAAVVTERSERDGVETVRIMDAVPLVTDREDVAALDAVFAAVVDDADADLFAAMAATVPRPSMRGLGFVRDDRPPLSVTSRPTVMVARPIGAGNWTVGGRDVLNTGNWRVSFAERDC